MRCFALRGLVVALAVVCFSVLAPSDLRAQEPPPDSPPQADDRPRLRERVVVTANRGEDPIDRVGSAVTVITREQIEASGAIWLADLLAAVPGLTVARTGGPGGVTSVFTRGTNSNHTLVLVNGLKVNAPGTGAYDWANLSSAQIERIEIIRGPQSTLYGSNAMGGVIQVITRRPGAGPRLEVSVEGGSYGTARGALRVEEVAGPLRLSLGVDAFNSANVSAADAAAGNTEGDRFRNFGADFRASYDPGGAWSAEAFATAFDGKARIDGFDFLAGPVDDLDALQDARDLYVGGTLRRADEGASLRLTVSRTSKRLEISNPNGFTTDSRLDGDITEADLQADLRHADGSRTTVGVEARRESAASRAVSAFGTSGFDESVGLAGVYAQHRRTWSRLDVVAGARVERHGQFGDAATYRITAAYRPARGWRAHGSMATGFRAPTFNELYFPGFGNPSLAAERSRGWDLGVGHDFGADRGRIDLTWFRNDLDNLVEFAFPAGFVNLGAVISRGVEVDGSYTPSTRVRLDASYTYTRAFAVGDDVQLVRRPRHQGAVTLGWRPAERWRLTAELRFKGARRDFGVVAPLQLDAYALLNLAIQVDVADRLRATARVENLADTDYQEVWGYGTPGLSAMVGLRYAWSPR